MNNNQDRKKAFVIINSEQKGFFTAISKVLSNNYNYDVTIVCRDIYVKKIVDKLLPNFVNIVVLSDIKLKEIPESDIVKVALNYEKKYGINLNKLMSEDRALGQGYLFNIEKIPTIIRSFWPYEKKLSSIIDVIRKYEIAINANGIIIQQWPNKIVHSIAKYNEGVSYSLVNMKYGNRFLWTSGEFVSGHSFIKRIKHNLCKNFDNKKYNYQSEEDGNNLNKLELSKFSYFNALKRALFLIWNDTKNWIRGMNKKNSYKYLGWVPSVFRKISNYKYVKSIGVTPDQLTDYNVIFYPLQMEPEVAILYYSPEFNNSMEAISQISKASEVGTIIVLKEQNKSFAVRSRWYYKQLEKIPNVVWADPDIHSWEWIKISKVVATITGTAGIEAVSMLKPVISFGKHQAINHLPTVFYVNSFDSVSLTIKDIFERYNEMDFEHSKNAFIKAQVDSSFDFPEYKNKFKSIELEVDLAEKSLQNLNKEYTL